MFPLWADRQNRTPNLAAGVLREVAQALGITVSAPDLMAYFAAVAAHPAYTLASRLTSSSRGFVSR